MGNLFTPQVTSTVVFTVIGYSFANILIMILGYIMDLVFGDPYWFPHPVRFIGKLISKTEKFIRKHAKSEKSLKYWGILMWLVPVVTTALVTALIVKIASFNKYVEIFVSAFIIYTTLSTKCLKDEATKIYNVLETGDIKKSRVQLSYIVGRDTTNLSQSEIIRATVETVAENTVDGTISPMFYGFLFGPVGAMTYKAINTLDSMVGYKNDKYLNLGCVSAKLDDVANFIPARLTAIFMPLGAFLCGMNGLNSFKIAIRDRKNHKSPNCAFAEGAAAGAIGVQLGGTNIYFGKEVYKPTIGDKKRELENYDIVRMNKLMYATTANALLILSALFCIMI
ncbi:cobalamin biosynthesis protein CobD [Peptacetobacter hiranonis DSM 13275]|uniref:Cobalamin biosynthesis protein CobD n=2 Tax=Peptacetobacter TaxID=2743582 RepID=B6FXU6_PEPHT|nr:adenosylcobinamide-phosphate synthase CbiB [Peptacetobacter hiranonis]EEA85661.1 cobalamin biosynthesis protein CobD [Peptacetobacter hiranonis DSM 13275]QEK19996.1 Cobalamin biosynthesis protein CobD [Peptacetobacter hiranonis]